MKGEVNGRISEDYFAQIFAIPSPPKVNIAWKNNSSIDDAVNIH